MKKLAAQGWLGMTWPKEYGGQEKQGVYEYILNEALARRGAPQIGKGVGIIGKTLIRHGSEKLKREFLPQIIARRDRVRGRLQRAAGRLRRREHAAQGREGGRRLEARTARRSGPPRRTSPTGTGSARAPTRTSRSTTASALFLMPMNHPGSRSRPCRRSATTSPTRSSSTTCSCPTTTWSGKRGSGFQYISEALDLERFTMFTLSPIEQTLERAGRVRARARRATASRCATTRWCAQQIAQLATDAEVARAARLRFVCGGQARHGGKPPTVRGVAVQAVRDAALAARRPTRRSTSAARRAQLRVDQDEAPLSGRFEGTYRAR